MYGISWGYKRTNKVAKRKGQDGGIGASVGARVEGE
jgi:hypothetical protein